MLDYDTLHDFVLDMGEDGKVSIQDSIGNIALVSPDVPDVHGLIERGGWFRIKDGPWMTRPEFEKIINEWKAERRHGEARK